MIGKMLKPGSLRNRMMALASGMAITLAPTAAMAARAPVVQYQHTGSPAPMVTQDGAFGAAAPSSEESGPGPLDGGPGQIQPEAAERRPVDVTAAYFDPMVQDANDRLEETGFTIVPDALHAGRDAEGRGRIFFGIDETGGAKAHDPEDALWTDAFRLGVIAVLDAEDRVASVVEARMTKNGAGDFVFLWESVFDRAEGLYARVVDTYASDGVHREVQLRGAEGQLMTAGEPGVDRIRWRCIRNCLRDEAIKLGTWAAICFGTCLVAAGVAAILTGGSAAVGVLKACTAVCKKKLLRKVIVAAVDIINCIGTRCL